MRKSIIFLFLCLLSSVILAQIPAGYYNRALGRQGRELQDSLCSIIDNHRVVHWSNSYYDTITHITVPNDTCVTRMFLLTDPSADGNIYDMYNGCTFAWEETGDAGTTPCMSYEKEHVFASKWFNGRDPQLADSAYAVYRDLHHLYPADRVVNNAKSDCPYGITGNYPWTTTYEIGATIGENEYVAPYENVEVPRVTVFEPADAYKGDFARSIFYITTRYMREDNTWRDDREDAPMNVKSQLRPWALNLLLEWHFADPVSAKEVRRNNAIYGIQGNRNPFIDHPELVTMIWGNDSAHYAFTDIPAATPHLIRWNAVANDLIEVEFSEPMSALSLQEAANFNIWPDYPAITEIQQVSNQVVRLHLGTALQNGKNYKCSFSNLQNESGTSYMRDTIVNLRYGYSGGQILIAGWTFDQPYVLGRVIPAASSCEINGDAAIYFDGTHGSDNFAIGNSDSLALPSGSEKGNFCSTGKTKALQFKHTSAFVANGSAFVIDCEAEGAVNNAILYFSTRYTNTGFKKLTYEWGENGEFTHIATDSLPATDEAATWYWHQIDLSRFLGQSFSNHIQIRITLDDASGTGNIQFDNIFLIGEKCLDEPVVYQDTIQRGQPYVRHGFNLSELETQQPGDNYFQLQTDNGDTCDGLVLLQLHVLAGNPLGITQAAAMPHFSLYPNPATDYVTLEGVDIDEVSVLNGAGQCIQTLPVNGNRLTLSVSNYPPGFYILSIVTRDRKVAYRKLIIQ